MSVFGLNNVHNMSLLGTQASEVLTHRNSLESVLGDQCFVRVDVNAPCEFPNEYHEPNEMDPEGIEPHLQKLNEEVGDDSRKKVHISVGGPRSLFHICFTSRKTCEGMIILDIHPRNKAYMDFEILLLRIANDAKEFSELSSPALNHNLFMERVSLIRKKVEEADLQPNVRKYYLEHLDDFASVNLKEYKMWRLPSSTGFEKCRYDQNNKLFRKVQNYAKSGNIVSIITDINGKDLSFSEKNLRVAVIDTSNICDYFILDIRGKGDFHPRVITTKIKNQLSTTYYSYIHDELANNERKEFDQLREKIKRGAGWMVEKFIPSDPFNADVGAIYSRKTLHEMRRFVAEEMLEVPTVGALHMDYDIGKLNQLTQEQIDELCENKSIKRFLPHLVEEWLYLNPSVYLSFSKIEGWKEAFEEHFNGPYSNFSTFLLELEEAGFLGELVQKFGHERLEALKQVHDIKA